MASLRLDPLTSDVSDIRLVRYATAELRIHVSDPDGGDVSEAHVVAEYVSDRVRGLPVESRRGDESFWRCLGVPPDELITVSATAAGFQSQNSTLRLQQGTKRDVAIVLQRSTPTPE